MRYISKSVNIPKFGMVFYNNLLSLAFLGPTIFIFNEFPAIMDPEIINPTFFFRNTLAAFFGFSLNFASLW